MATILLVEDAPDLILCEAGLLAAHGHTVLRCTGGPGSSATCPLLSKGSCPLLDRAEVVIFSCGLVAPIRGRNYRGMRLLRAYRSHPSYALLPLLIVSAGTPGTVAGPGPCEVIEKYSAPRAVVGAVERLLAASRAA